MMTRAQMAVCLRHTMQQVEYMRAEGQKEYARSEDNAFANFERVGLLLGLDRKQVLMVYAYKHLDGIIAYLNGHQSQRESVHGRVYDLITYLALLVGMIDDERGVTGYVVYPEKVESPGYSADEASCLSPTS